MRIFESLARYGLRNRRFLNRALFLLFVLAAFLAFYFLAIFGLTDDELSRIYSTMPGALNSLVAIGVAVLVTTFSFVFVALSLVSVQFSPRVVRQFWHSDPFRWFFLWAYVGIFAACFLIQFLDAPRLQLLTVVLGVYLIFVLFPVFLTYLANNLNAATIVQVIARRTLIEIVDQYEPVTPSAREDQSERVSSKKSGYLEHIDVERLSAEFSRIRKKHPNATLQVSNYLGSFIEVSSTLAVITPRVGLDRRTESALRRCFNMGRFRSIDQDIGYGIRQLVDIAIKAISPAVNDPTTCVNCLHYLGVIIKSLALRESRSIIAKRLEKDGVFIREPKFERYVDDAFDQIYQWGRRDVVVVRAMLNTLSDIISVLIDAEKCEVIANQVGNMELDYLLDKAAESPITLIEHRNRLRRTLRRFCKTAATQFAKCGQPERANAFRQTAERLAASMELVARTG